MAAEKLVKDVGDVYGKLFNHRGPILRECDSYVHEFEVKRKDREISRLNQAAVNCSHIESLLPQVESLSVANLRTMLEKLDKAVVNSTEITDHKLPEENTTKVEDRRRRMQEDWESFEIKNTKSREEIEQCHIERMQKLQNDIELFANDTKQ